MDSITLLIKNEIKRQYKSLRSFSEASGIPYSTLSNALTKGIGGTSYDTVMKICCLLNIKQAFNEDLILFNRAFHDFYLKLVQLDDQGLHTVNTVLNIEYDRCTQDESEPTLKGFNGIGFASQHEPLLDMEQIKSLIKKVLEDEKKR